jgi:hypothetical protein
MSTHDKLLTGLGLLATPQPIPRLVSFAVVGAAGCKLAESNSLALAERLADGYRSQAIYCTIQTA